MSKHSFEHISKVELAGILKKFRLKDELVKVWQKGHPSSQVKLREVNETSKECKLTILPLEKLEFISGQNILVNFFYDGVDYFAETEFVKKDASIVELKLLEKIFMVEKRKYPRYLCYPEDEVFFVVDIPKPKAAQADVLEFDREKRQEMSFLKRFREKIENKGLKYKEGFETLKFRVLDISKRGLALYCSDDEFQFYNLEQHLKTGYILVNDQIYNVNIERIIYDVDYLLPRAKSISMKKIGLGLEENDVLNDYLEKLENSTVILTQSEKDFEDIEV